MQAPTCPLRVTLPPAAASQGPAPGPPRGSGGPRRANRAGAAAGAAAARRRSPASPRATSGASARCRRGTRGSRGRAAPGSPAADPGGCGQGPSRVRRITRQSRSGSGTSSQISVSARASRSGQVREWPPSKIQASRACTARVSRSFSGRLRSRQPDCQWIMSMCTTGSPVTSPSARAKVDLPEPGWPITITRRIGPPPDLASGCMPGICPSRQRLRKSCAVDGGFPRYDAGGRTEHPRCSSR